MAEFSAVGALSQLLLLLLVAGMAGSCDASLLRSKFMTRHGFHGISCGLLCQFVVLPLLGFAALTLFPQPPAIAVTLLVVTTSPGGGFSGFWCYVANADLALSVAMTTASTLVSVIALPLNLTVYVSLLYGRHVDFGFLRELIVACSVVIVGVLSGYAVARSFRPDVARRRRQRMSLVGQGAGVALMVLGAATSSASSEPVWRQGGSWYCAIALPAAGGLVIAMCLAKLASLPSAEAVAVAIECAYQNTGLALTIALSALPAAQAGAASGVPLVYGVLELALIPLFALAAWKLGWTYAPPDENFVIALFGNYQPSADPGAGGVAALAVSSRLATATQATPLADRRAAPSDHASYARSPGSPRGRAESAEIASDAL